MPHCHCFPHRSKRHGWLMTDARLEGHGLAAARRLPPASVVIVRSDDLAPAARRRLICALRRVVHARRSCLLLAATTPDRAARMGADGVHLRCRSLRRAAQARRLGLSTSAPVHDRREAGAARRAGIGHVLISPLHPTRSHAGAATLTIRKFLMLARYAAAQPVALGGMTAARHRNLLRRATQAELRPQWAAIDAWETASTGSPGQKRNCVPT